MGRIDNLPNMPKSLGGGVGFRFIYLHFRGADLHSTAMLFHLPGIGLLGFKETDLLIRTLDYI